MANIKIINPSSFLANIEQSKCNNNIFHELSSDNFLIEYSDVKSTHDYKEPENEKTKEKFPFCCTYHKSIFENTQKWFDNFPNCCSDHKKLLNTLWFNKNKYSNVALKVVQQVSYTENHVINQIKENDWLEDILDYIEVNVSSFGQLPNNYGSPIGLNQYLECVTLFLNDKNWLKHNKVSIEKGKKLSNSINEIYYKEKNNNPKSHTDLNVLKSTYDNWLSLFPFKISYFKDIKESYLNKLPILTGEQKRNKYSGHVGNKLHTKESLIRALVNLTNNLLSNFNSVVLFEKGLLTDAKKIQLELIVENRKIQINENYNYSAIKDENEYRGILKKWLKEEKDFISEIVPLMNFENDLDFISGKITISNTFNGYFTITKNGYSRKFTVEHYFNLHLENWTNEIEKAILKKDKINIASNGVLSFNKLLLEYKEPNMKTLIEEKILFLKEVITHIDNTYEDLTESQLSPKEPENIEYNTRIFTSVKGYILFDKLIKLCPKVNDTYSFIYLKLVQDGYIYENIKHREIKDFFNSEPYKITIDKIKTLNILTNDQRMALYSSVLDSIK